MSEFNFDKETIRLGSHSLKWDVKEGELPMWVADMDFEAAPCIAEALRRRTEHGIYGYSVVPDEWFDAYIEWWKRRHGLIIKREWLQFSTGIVPAISSIVRRVTNVGDNIALLTPVYDIFFHSVENFGRHVLECKLKYDESYSIDLDELESALAHPLTTMLILCNPHNPTGNVWTRAELERIAALCDRYGVTVLSDEIHCDITQGKKYTPFALVSGGRGITCISASKAFNIAGLQSAAVVIPDPILRNKVVRGLNSDEVAEPNCFAAEGAVAALNGGEKWLEELNEYIAENKRLAYEALDKIKGVKAVKSYATYLMWIDCSGITSDSDELCEFIRSKTGLYLSAGSQYRGNGDRFLRMNVACPRSRLLDGLDRFARAISLYK